ncbi:EamA family transporter [Solicola sp. PLA-1-18]|uniref:EamA family transporter n=1 Tax=Solicola sp. PLA-1-18 TaxID=3380532 RepID=UPI003B7CB26E
MAVVLSLVSALAYGVSDFLGGIFARRASAWQVAVVGQSSSAVCAALLGLVLTGTPVTADWGWGALAGLGGGVGAAFLYRGFAGGRMSVIAPVSAVGAAVVPVVVGLATGERPSAWAWIGIVAAFPAIVLVSRTPGARDASGSTTASVLDGVVAGVGFGLLFVFLDRIGEDAGIMPLAVSQVTSVLAVVATATLLRQAWVPRGQAWWALTMGPLGASATGAFLYATHSGLLSIVSVITALYPATTVLLAAVLLREQVHRLQGVGLVLATAAVTLVALG